MIRLVIVNPKAGKSKGEHYIKTIGKIFKNIQKEGLIKKDKVFIEQTKYVGHATEIVRDYLKSYTDQFVIYIVGGDGTVGEITKACIYVDRASIVIIPKGTGNDFAKVTNSYRSIRKIIRSSIDTKPISVDSIKVKDNVCINVLNAGFDAAIADNMNLFRKWPVISGSMKYKLAIFYTLFSAKKYKFKIRVDEKIYKGIYTLVAIGNSKYYGGGINVLPDAVPTDGVLDICIIKATTLLQKLIFLPKFSKGKHIGLSIVEMLKGKNVSIVANKKFPISIDGEIIITNRFNAKIQENSVNIIKTLDN